MPGVKTLPPRTEIENEEERMKDALRDKAVDQLSEVSNPDAIHVRDILPDADLDSGSDNGWGGSTRLFEQAGMSTLSENHIYTIDPDNAAENKLVGVFAIGSKGDPDATEIIFKDNTGSVIERAQVEEVLSRDEEEVALLKNPILVGVDETVEVHLYSDGGSDDNVTLHGATAEKRGKTLGERA